MGNGVVASRLDGSITSYEWDTDGDGYYGEYEDASSGETTTLSFSSDGSYTVQLQVSDNGGVSSTATATIPVSLPPEPSLTASTESIGRNQPVTFDASDSIDRDGTITKYIWRFENGEIKHGESVTRSFSVLGQQEVTLIVVDDSGHRVETTGTVSVYPKPSVDIAVQPTEPIAGTPVQFEARSDDPIDTYEWDVDGDGNTDYTGRSVEHTFWKSGDHTVQVTVVTEEGIVNKTSRVVSVDPERRSNSRRTSKRSRLAKRPSSRSA
ncbi:PKD domain-containing protein [Natrinema halophilum]|uniref:PKD domain-containing protein n=1 Tax=Natrinema halophilum TaxID=1699371 RepID=A0A7D5GU32_9EURY|nr:PKD domain-containing protein [Natrinema halophilum]QLG49766.1 PKD domain-containing protein [Natrinema halophilum]